MAGRSEFNALQEEYADFVGRAAAVYGLNPLLGRLYGLLVLSPQPLTLDDLAERVGAAKSTISVAMRNLEKARVVRREWKRGDRRDFFVARTDVHAVLTEWNQYFFQHELRFMEQGNRTAREGIERSLAGPGWPTEEERSELLRRLERLDDLIRLATDLLNDLLQFGESDPSRSQPARTIEIEIDGEGDET